MSRETDIVEQFKDLDVAETVKTLTDTPTTIPTSGPGLHVQNAYLAAKSLSELLGQKKQVGVIRVTNGMNAGTHISTISYDYNYAMNNHFGNGDLANNTATKFFKGFRANLKVTYEVTSMFQQQGALILNAINIPPILYNNMSFSKVNIYNLAKLPRRFLTLGHNGTYEAVIPWESNLKFWPFSNFASEVLPQDMVSGDLGTSSSSYNSNGSLILRVFAPMKVGPTATDFCQVRIYSQLTNIEFCVYSPVQGGL
uniref:Uncharacterized protein n=1 Tax=Apple picorna-like virus 1 TaxID=2709736 RepID=A0A6C0X1D0_9VIRU|nr:MAG: hypothetical protein [Apple picorna-like virus 1]